MVYFEQEDGFWVVGARGAFFPDGTEVSADSPNPKNGYKWHTVPPQAFLDWIHSLSGEELAYAMRTLPKGIPGLPDLPPQAGEPN